MIHHLSIAARDPKQPLRCSPNSWEEPRYRSHPTREVSSRYSLMSTGLEWRSIPPGTELQPGGTTGGTFVKKDARGYGSTHFALDQLALTASKLGRQSTPDASVSIPVSIPRRK